MTQNGVREGLFFRLLFFLWIYFLCILDVRVTVPLLSRLSLLDIHLFISLRLCRRSDTYVFQPLLCEFWGIFHHVGPLECTSCPFSSESFSCGSCWRCCLLGVSSVVGEVPSPDLPSFWSCPSETFCSQDPPHRRELGYRHFFSSLILFL